jgi:hypothetical protein
MRNVYRVLAYLLSIEVLVQGMAIAYAIAGLGKWVEDDGGVLNKQVMDSDNPDFPGVGGFAIHGINGTMIIPIVVLLLLIVSFFAKIPGGSKWAAFILLDVIVQIVFAFSAFGAPVVGMFHGLNALLLAWLGWTAAKRIGVESGSDAVPREAELV